MILKVNEATLHDKHGSSLLSIMQMKEYQVQVEENPKDMGDSTT